MYCYQRIKDLRTDADLKQKDIAEILGIDQRVYSNYETGKREIPTHLLIALADYYKTTTDYILGRTNDSKIKY
ncbi:MAG: helix-turn-helix domain-containing protein [Eubacterium sp.]